VIGRSSGRVGIGAALLAASVLLLACDSRTGRTTPTPGPAARAGSAIDKAWSTVQSQVADALLMTRIRVALLERLKEDGMRVTIEVRGGSVELSGQVEKAENVELAGRVAASVSGVRTVRSRVTLGAAGQILEPPIAHALGEAERAVANAVLEGNVKSRLLEELGKVAFDIEVEATNGVVTLSGTVPDGTREKLAVQIAKGTPGVKELHDLLKVKAPEDDKGERAR
jgi:hyperosmotically inducible periplasmic protein